MNYLTLGIIGHVDHGKTALVKVLTGIDTDRLKEEKERGISIVLGYSHLQLPHGEIGVIDVPGHEKFIRTMVSGATGINAVMLVVDINEGVKPQTIEHLNIATLLGVKNGIIAVTKCDTTEDADLRELIAEEIHDIVAETFLEGAPLVFTSAVTGEGLDPIREELDALLRDAAATADEGAFYLPVDRVFSMSGFGTVATGTLRRGALRVGDEVELYPHGVTAKVRELQSHKVSTKEARPGFRTAVNLRGIDKQQLHRGDVVATPGTLRPATVLDAQLALLKDAADPLKHGQIVRLLYGTSESYARLHLLDRGTLVPGETCVAQFKHEAPVATLNGEPFIVRTYSPMQTVGGGRILGSRNKRLRRRDSQGIRRLEIIARANPPDVIVERLLEADNTGLSLAQLFTDTRIRREALPALLESLPVQTYGSQRAIHDDVFDRLCADVVQTIDNFHQDSPTLKGISKSQLNDALAETLDPVLLDHTVHYLESNDVLAVDRGLVHRANFDSAQALSDSDRAVVKEIESAFQDAALKPPAVEEILANSKARKKLYQFLVDDSVLVTTGQNARAGVIAFHRDAIEEAKRRIEQQFPPPQPFSVSEAKTVLDISRKYAIPLLEHLDSIGFTKRSGDQRVLANSA